MIGAWSSKLPATQNTQELELDRGLVMVVVPVRVTTEVNVTVVVGSGSGTLLLFFVSHVLACTKERSYLVSLCTTVLVTKRVDVPPLTVDSEPVGDFLPVLVLSNSTSVSNNNVVDKSMVSIVSVNTACSVATIKVPGPDTVAVKPIGRVVVSVRVTITISHTSWYRLHSRSPLSRTLQIFTSTSEGVSPAVRDCHGASQYVKLLLTVGAGVMSDALLVIGVGVSKAKPHSVENVTS
jgi:hypothetical protein